MFYLIIFLRGFKVIIFFYEIKEMQIILDTMKSLLVPISQNIFILFFNFYVFALVGMIIFGGKNRKGAAVFVDNMDIPYNYHLLNFNDLLSSYVTLFSLMVVNNWMVLVDLYVLLMDNQRLYRIYFYAFYYISVLISINLVVAYTIDMYSSVERINQERTETMEYLKNALDINEVKIKQLMGELDDKEKEQKVDEVASDLFMSS